jgi:hypothetical protein
MDKIVFGTPLPFSSVSKDYTFASGLAIRSIRPILWELSAAKGYMSDDERRRLSEAPYWLCASKETENWHLAQPADDLYEEVRLGMYALQIICPSGASNQYFKFCETPEGFDNIGGWHPAKMTSTLMGRLAVLDGQRLNAEFDVVFRGVQRAFKESVVRLVNPVLLLEHGLQINHPYLSMLMWVMGLDMLYMAGERQPFVDRVSGFLGSNTLIFPPFIHQQPRLTIDEVLDHLYELRNFVAHGREIPRNPFLEKFNIVDRNGRDIDLIEYTYSQVLMESALFLLTESLRKIMTEGLVDTVRDDASWKQTLKINVRLDQMRNSHRKERC